MRMKTYSLSIGAGLLVLVSGFVYAGSVQLLSGFGSTPSTAFLHQFNELITGNWQVYGQQFTNLQAFLFNRAFLLIITIVPTVFLLHYITIGPKIFAHDGDQVYYFNLFSRIIHLIGAVSFSLLVITGLMIIFGKFFGGGTPVHTARLVHIASAAILAVDVPIMFAIWFVDMLPRTYDLAWFLILGGYLSKKKKPVPAGRFNAGQKVWFWLCTLGSGGMIYTGYLLYTFQSPVDQLRLMVIIHNFLGMALVAFFLTHLYMSLFAIKGSIHSMITGYKPREEVEILHSRYKI